MLTNNLVAAQWPATIKFSDGGVYIITHMECDESISKGLNIIASVCCPEELVENLLGKKLQITFRHNDNVRNYNAVAIDLIFTGYDQDRGLYFYQILARDPLSLLDLREQRKIYQNMTTKKILEDIFRTSNISFLIKFSLINNDGVKHRFCTQMHETDLTFVQRLMADEGWHYHVDHSTDEPIVVIADTNQVFEELADAKISWLHKGQYIENFRRVTSLGTSKISLTNYSLESGQITNSGARKSIKQYPSLSLHSILYGSENQNKNEIKNTVKLHMETIDNNKETIFATSKISVLSAGKSFHLIDHPIELINQKYIISNITHTITSDESGRKTQYHNSLRCVSASIPFRQKIPEKKKIYGLYTATVTGPKGEEIYTDKVGRVKVQFHWDNDGNMNENSSCWLPVSQNVAGKGFGLQFLPRVGHQVLIQYIEGNPNNPVIVGSFYNQENDIPWSSATQSGIKTRTTPQGNRKQGNELRFEDQKGSESILIHAEKDLILESNSDFISTVNGKKTSTVDRNVHFLAKEAIEIVGGKTLMLTSKETMSSQSDKDINIQAGGSGKFSSKSVISLSSEIIDISGTNKIKINVGDSKIEISNDAITLCAAKISITSLGTTKIAGTTVNIEGTAKTDIKSLVVNVDSGTMTEIKSAALVNIQGAITKIN